MGEFDWLDRKIDEVETDYKLGNISEEEYQSMMDAIESKKKKSTWKSLKNTVNIIKQLRWNTEEIKNMKKWYESWLISKAEYNQYLRMNHSYIPKKKTSLWSYIFLWCWALWYLAYLFLYLPNKTYITVDDFSEMWDPIQVPVSWTITRVIEWQKLKIDLLAKYTIRWRVVATAQYWSNLLEKILWSWYLTDNSIRYRDVWLWWWFLTQDDYVKRFTFDSFNRFLYPKVKSDKDWKYISQDYTWDDIWVHFSHNHLVPVDKRVKRLLRWIKKWNYVQIKWYLVSLHWENWYELKSSLVRDDSWDWACETILVTDVVWLKEKKK